MSYLSRELRRALENTIKAARAAAEAGAADALRRLGVAAAELPAHLESRRADRNRLRAHARSLGDPLRKSGEQDVQRLTEAAAYVQWHRLLFARFLLERGLLRDETGVPVSLSDCREEAALSGAGDEWSIASAHAARMLPGVFPPDDPVESLRLAPEHAKALRDLVRGKDAAILDADHSLGRTYQFWRAAEKQAVNDSQVKIGAAELPAVTQLFTEPYMVRFLLHNTLGAWWAGKALAARPDLARDEEDEAALRAACALPGYTWDYLRFVREGGVWRPAAGGFPGWPQRAAEITFLDPCCGSGHFLTEALAALVALRGVEEGLSPADAVVAALRDNIHGLEIDGRCVQIAAFALALTAWRIGGAETRLPIPHVAWVGAPPPLPKSEFVALANGDADLQRGLAALHDLFAKAPLLGSLIEVTGGDLASPTRIARIEDSVGALVQRMRKAEPERAEGALAARGMADAAAILPRRFVLQATNVPFLGRGRQDDDLKHFLADRYDAAKSDLAMAMLSRMHTLAAKVGAVAAVTPQSWLYLGSYKKMREAFLESKRLLFVAGLGSRAFETIGGEVVNVVLVAVANEEPDSETVFAGLDANDEPDPTAKAATLLEDELRVLPQLDQRQHPDSIITLVNLGTTTFLTRYASCYQGTSTSDNDRCIRKIWELSIIDPRWDYFAGPPERTDDFSGLTNAVNWLTIRSGITSPAIRGDKAWGKRGLIFGQMTDLPSAFFTGTKFGNSSPVLIADELSQLAAVASFVRSGAFLAEMRNINKKVSIDNGYITKVPFDLSYWQVVASKMFPNGLPEPYSEDPTQWLFHGHPRHAESGTELHVALARLASYLWPAETDSQMRLSNEARAHIAAAAELPEADPSGLLALVPVLGERPLADRLRAYCIAVWGAAWTPGMEAKLVTDACERAKDKPPKQLTFDAWLRAHAARQHAKLFHDRPFLWWISDGRADGFTVVANYHRLTRANLERLAYTVLGDWITRLGDDPRTEAARVLQSKLALILEGEQPYDIFVRWKPLEEQPLGWDPDFDDGVRLNIRPFIEAEALAFAPNVKYGVDRGKDVASAPWYAKFNGERRNDHHTTLAEKRAAQTSKP